MAIILPDGAQKPTTLFGVQFAPLNIPLERRLQTLAVFQWTLCFLLLGFSCLGLTVYLLFTKYYFVVLLYSVWYVYDWKKQEKGGRSSDWVRRWKIWEYYRDFFPIKLIKVADLDPSRNYILGYHPHGIMAFGAFNNFATEATGFSRLFPGLKSRVLILAGQFFFPVHREYVMSSGKMSLLKIHLCKFLSHSLICKGKLQPIKLIWK